MSNLIFWDWWLVIYFLVVGVVFVFYVGQLVVKLLLIKFVSYKCIDDGLWCFGILVEICYG